MDAFLRVCFIIFTRKRAEIGSIWLDLRLFFQLKMVQPPKVDVDTPSCEQVWGHTGKSEVQGVITCFLGGELNCCVILFVKQPVSNRVSEKNHPFKSERNLYKKNLMPCTTKNSEMIFLGDLLQFIRIRTSCLILVIRRIKGKNGGVPPISNHP